MLRYHLARVLRPALILVLLVFVYLTIVNYRQGGAEDIWGGFGYFRVLMYWGIMGPLLLLGIAASTPANVMARAEQEPLALTRPPLRRAILDSLLRLVALAVPLLIAGVFASLFLSGRVPDAVLGGDIAPGVQDPVTVSAIWMVLLVGPVAGGIALLAFGEVVGAIFRSSTARILVVGIVAMLDAVDRLGSPWLSPSGTRLSIVQITTGTERTPFTADIPGTPGPFWISNGLWGQNIVGQQATVGPISVDVDASLVVARVSLLVLAVGLMIGISVWRVRRLQWALE